MTDITQDFGTLYHPISALIIYQTKDRDRDTYVEHFDMDKNGTPTNAHPLTEREGRSLVRALTVDKEKSNAFLKPKGILSTKILFVNPIENGSVIWYTKTRREKLFFTESLEIPNGAAEVPAMLWYASKQNLMVFALASDRRPTDKTALYHAPFFNMYDSGSVCMGTVNVNIKNSASVEEFTHAWESYFFNSYFSHLINNHNPIKGNCVTLWRNLVSTGNAFPKEVLKRTGRTIKNLLK